MTEQRNIVVLGASFGGIQAAQHIYKHVLPLLKSKQDAKYHVYVISPSADFYFRVASPRVGTSTTLLPAENIFMPLKDAFKGYSENDFTFIQAFATGLDTNARKVQYKRSDYLQDESLSYHALIVATGSKTHHAAFSQHTDTQATMDAIKTMNSKVSAAKDIVIVGGGATGVETAGEMGEFLNGKPGWFSTPERKVNITLITAANQLLPPLRPAIGKQAEDKLKKLGVDVLYNTRVADVNESSSGKTVVTLAKGEKMEVDLYIPAHGVVPNSSWLPANLLNDSGYLKVNDKTLRVEEAGPRVYGLGDIASNSRNTIMDLNGLIPVAIVNLKRDLLAYNPNDPNAKPSGKDRHFEPMMKEMMIVPVGSAGGVGAVMGFKVPSWFVWLLKSRTFMVDFAGKPLMNGDNTKKDIAFSKEEAVA